MKGKETLSKLLPLILVLCFQLPVHSQAPQGFSYQAVVRNGTGTPITDKTIGLRITIQDTLQVVYYTETHTPKSNAQGVISVTIGRGNRVGIKPFISIPWQTGKVFIKAEIDPEGGTSYIAMGEPTKLQSVPYALYAENTKEIVSKPNALEDDPIFEVKNSKGQVVFGVYQAGVRVYVDDSPTIKGARGGFAVGGLSQTKAGFAEYFRITPDSARVYVRTITKGARGGFAVGGLSQTKGTGNNYLQLTPDNYFIGQNSGQSISSGKYNSVFGYFSGSSLNSGSKNTFIGNQVGEKTTLGSSNVLIGNFAGNANIYGSQNIFIGDSAGLLNGGTGNILIGSSAGKKSTNTWNAVFIGNSAGANDMSGWPNTFIGNNAGYNNTSGGQNTFIGNFCGYKNTIGTSNVFIGNNAAYSNIDGQQNVIIGENASYNSTNGGGNVFIGFNSAYSNQTSHGNTFVGNYTGYQITPGNGNTFLGNGSGSATSIGEENVFIGYSAGGVNKEGSWNTYVGRASGLAIINGNANTFLGYGSGYYKTSGDHNVFIGTNAGSGNTSGSRNVFIGSGAGEEDKGSNKLYIANSGGDSTQALVYGEFDHKILTFNANVGIGTFKPDKKLHVEGDARITGDIYYGASPSVTKYTKADYVFTSNYDKYLEPLKVDDFIKTNGHLPWITSAKSETGGINLTRMQFETVETVENLQLQIIELKKEHQQEIDSIKAELKAIKDLLKK